MFTPRSMELPACKFPAAASKHCSCKSLQKNCTRVLPKSPPWISMAVMLRLTELRPILTLPVKADAFRIRLAPRQCALPSSKLAFPVATSASELLELVQTLALGLADPRTSPKPSASVLDLLVGTGHLHDLVAHRLRLKTRRPTRLSGASAKGNMPCSRAVRHAWPLAAQSLKPLLSSPRRRHVLPRRPSKCHGRSRGRLEVAAHLQGRKAQTSQLWALRDRVDRFLVVSNMNMRHSCSCRT